MNCVNCLPKYCRSDDSCGAEKFEAGSLQTKYAEPVNQSVVQAAAELVDNGRAGGLSRLDEMIEFIKKMKYQKVGLAYCYGMEQYAVQLKDFFKLNGIKLSTVSCTVGGMQQSAVNLLSSNNNVSCNPVGQAEQLKAEKTDFVILMGICLGHDILLQRSLTMDFTTFVVKERLYNHQPLLALK